MQAKLKILGTGKSKIFRAERPSLFCILKYGGLSEC